MTRIRRLVAPLVLLVPSAAWAQACDVSDLFDGFRDIPIGGAPRGIALADFNGDGLPDLAVATAASGTEILLADGTGAFLLEAMLATERDAVALGTGDMNGDGFQDVAVFTADVSSGRDGAEVFFGDGAGGFGPSNFVDVGPSPLAGTVADLNGDGLADLAIGNGDAAGTTSIRLSNGDGTFTARGPFQGTPAPVSLSAADIDGDGFADLAFASTTENAAIVLFGRGDGTFAPRTVVPAGDFVRSATIVDANGDGLLDLAASNAIRNTVTVLINAGARAFEPPVAYAAGDRPQGLAAADLDGDGNMDLVAASFGAGGVSVLPGVGDGTFAPWVAFDAPDRLIVVATADVDGDGAIDVVAADNSNPGTVAAFANRCLAPPRVTRGPESVAVDAGASIELTIEVGPGARPLSFQWRRNGAPLADGAGIGAEVSGSTTDTLALSGLTSAASDAYDVVVTNAAGEAISSPSILAVRDTCIADVDNDGSLTLFDFLAFQNAFDLGCP